LFKTIELDSTEEKCALLRCHFAIVLSSDQTFLFRHTIHLLTQWLMWYEQHYWDFEIKSSTGSIWYLFNSCYKCPQIVL